MEDNNILGVVLAGGKSRRFGEDKNNIKLGNKTFLEHVLSKINKKFNEISSSHIMLWCLNSTLAKVEKSSSKTIY